ncbi:UNVERIFIED_CONTAM: hypothetical protein K2H54_004766 [Gekko kuhli]
MTALKPSAEEPPTTDITKMLDIISSFYKDLYMARSTGPTSAAMEEYILKHQARPANFDPDELQRLLEPFTELEVSEALTVGRRSSTPGPDGLPYGLYRDLKDLFLPILTEVFNYIWETKTVDTSTIRTEFLQTSGVRDTEGEGEGPTDTIKIFRVQFYLTEDGWRRNWDEWYEKVSVRLQQWKNWSLSTEQKIHYFNTYCIPVANYLAGIYPPPMEIITQLTRQLFTWILGMTNFPLARVVLTRRHSEGGLGVVDLGLCFLAKFLVVNCGQMLLHQQRDERESATSTDVLT